MQIEKVLNDINDIVTLMTLTTIKRIASNHITISGINSCYHQRLTPCNGKNLLSRTFHLFKDDVTTRDENKEWKFLVNGKIVIVKNGKAYNVATHTVLSHSTVL